MLGEVTVTGGAGKPPLTLQYDASGLAYVQAKALAASIDDTYSAAIYYQPGSPPLTPSPGYLVIRAQNAAYTIDARGFGAVVDENVSSGSTIMGGDATGGQIVLARGGGLQYRAARGDNTVVAGSGANHISFAGDDGADAAYTDSGNDTIIGGGGSTTVSAGLGSNRIVLGGGRSLVYSTGRDTIALGSAGDDTIDVLRAGSVLVRGAQAAGAKLHFVGGSSASTVLGGQGSYTIFGGRGGGVFTGGSGGDNSITGGVGSATITGGGAGDTLHGGQGSDLIVASLGNETLNGGGGSNELDLRVHSLWGNGGTGTVDKINDFTSLDLLNVGGIRQIDYALNTYRVNSSGNGHFLLEDGTKVVLHGYAGPLSASDFKH